MKPLPFNQTAELKSSRASTPEVQPIPPEAEVALARALDAYSLASVRRIGQRLGLGKTPELAKWGRDRLFPAIAQRLHDREFVHSLLQGISRLQRVLLEFIAGAGGMIHLDDLTRQVKTEGLFPPAPLDDMTRSLTEQLAEPLARGLLWPIPEDGTLDFSRIRWGRAFDVVWLHPYVQAWLAPAREEEGAYRPERVTGDAPRPLLHDASSLLSFCRQTAPRLLRTGGVRKRDRDAVLGTLVGPPEGMAAEAWFDFLWRIVVAADLVIAEGDRAVLSPRGEAYLATPDSEQMLRLWRAWRDEPVHNEFLSIPELGIDPPPRSRYASYDVPDARRVQVARRVALEALGRYADGEWHPISALQRAIRLARPDLLVDRRGSWDSAVYAGIQDSDGPIQKRDGWHRIEGRFIGRLLTSPLLAFGAVLVDWDLQGSTPRGFLITPPGADLLNDRPPVLPRPEGAPGMVLPTGDVYLYPDRCEPALAEQVRAFCAHVSTEKVIHFRVTEPAVRQALQDGWSARDMSEVLASVAEAGLPQNLEAQLADWERRSRRILVASQIACTEPEARSATANGRPRAIDYGQILPPVRTSYQSGLLILEVAGEPLDWELERLCRWLGARRRREGRWEAPLAELPASRSPVDADGFPTRPVMAGDEILRLLARRHRGEISPPIRLALRGWCGVRVRRPALRALVELKAPGADWLDDVLSLPEAQACLVTRAADTTALLDAATSRALLERMADEFGWPLAEGRPKHGSG